MKVSRHSMLTLLTEVLVLILLLSGLTRAHTAIAVNGSMHINIKRSGLIVEYQIECGARTPIDVRSKMDTNGDRSISQKELKAFNETARRKLRETKTLCYLLVDTRPAMLVPQKVEFAVDNMMKPHMVLMKFRLVSNKPLSPGFHRLVLESNFCPYDGELLPLPDGAAPLVHQRHGRLVRIIKVVVLSEAAVEFSHVSTGHISERGGKKTVQCILNNITKRLQVNFMLGDVQSNEQSPADSEQGKENKSSVNAITGATPIALRSPVRVTEIYTFDALTFDPKDKSSGVISYKLSKPAWIRIRIVLRGNEQVVLRTLVDWSKRQTGKHVERWDGKDESGHLIDKRTFPCFVKIEADSKVHQEHPRAICRDFRLNAKLKDSGDGAEEGKTEVEIILDEAKQSQGQSSGYTVRAYVNFKLVHSSTHKERTWPAFDFPLDTTNLSTGEHLLTVVVDDGADHVGSTSLKFNVLN